MGQDRRFYKKTSVYEKSQGTPHMKNTKNMRGQPSKRENVFSRTGGVFLRQWLLQRSAPRDLDSFNTCHILQLIFTTPQGSKHLHINNPITQAGQAGQKSSVSTLHPAEQWCECCWEDWAWACLAQTTTRHLPCVFSARLPTSTASERCSGSILCPSW